MKKIAFLILISLNLFATCCSYAFPKGKMDPEILNQYLPQIWNEIENGFAFQDDGRTRRFTREYGYSFFKMEQNDFDYSPPPLFLQELGAHICQTLGHEPIEFTNIILSYYDNDFYLEPHVDVGETDLYENCRFYFDEKVYGIIIEADPTGHLYFVEWHEGLRPPLGLEPVFTLQEETGTVFCLQDELRKTPFFHGVSQISNRRISITFRTVVIENDS